MSDDSPKVEVLVPSAFRNPERLRDIGQPVSGAAARRIAEPASYVVDGGPQRTAARHGLSGAEIERLSGAIRLMEAYQRRRSGLWWVTTDKGCSREIIADIGKRITRLQAEYGLPRYGVTVFECRGGLHAHVIYIGTQKIAQRLTSSAAFGGIIKVARVPDPNGLACKYLAKERTPQAGYRRQHLLGGRIRGSHRLEGGGDRVRLSRNLERDAIEAGHVKSWRHTNAKRNRLATT